MVVLNPAKITFIYLPLITVTQTTVTDLCRCNRCIMVCKIYYKIIVALAQFTRLRVTAVQMKCHTVIRIR